jgi:hypothetical protein
MGYLDPPDAQREEVVTAYPRNSGIFELASPTDRPTVTHTLIGYGRHDLRA